MAIVNQPQKKFGDFLETIYYIQNFYNDLSFIPSEILKNDKNIPTDPKLVLENLTEFEFIKISNENFDVNFFKELDSELKIINSIYKNISKSREDIWSTKHPVTNTELNFSDLPGEKYGAFDGKGDLIRAMSWLNIQPFKPINFTKTEYIKYQFNLLHPSFKGGQPNRIIVYNEERISTLVSWLKGLSLCYTYSNNLVKPNFYLPLFMFFKEKNYKLNSKISLSSFFDDLGKYYPWIQFGKFGKKMIKDVIDISKLGWWKNTYSTKQKIIEPSIVHALRRVQSEGIIEFIDVPDASEEPYIFTDNDDVERFMTIKKSL